jgi:hypothetical protein
MYVRALQLQRAVVRWTRVVSAFDPLSSGFWTPISSIKAPDDGTSNNTSMYSEHCGTVAPRVVHGPDTGATAALGATTLIAHARVHVGSKS